MSATPSHRRLALLLLTGLLLTAPPASAAGLHATDLLHRAWSLLTNFWSEAGCYIDPNGRCAPHAAPPAPAADEGCRIDPNGRCGA